jgi:hypothetical protein
MTAMNVLWLIDTLLGKELETDEYSRCYAIGGKANTGF